MSVRDTTGVRGLARILSRLSESAPRTVAELAHEEAIARATAYDLVRRLELARLVARDATGKLIAGPAAVAFSFARFGLARLHGPAEALLGWLRDHSDATSILSCGDNEERVTLAALPANWDKSPSADHSTMLSYAVCAADGGEVARIEAICRPGSSRAERARTELLALRVKASLERHLREEATVC